MFDNKVYHKIDSLSGSVASLRADGVKYGEIAEIESRAGTSLAQVIKLDGASVTLQIFAGARGVDTAARVRFLGETMRVPFGEELLGRAFTGAGKPRDGGPALSGNLIPIGQPSVNPAKRIMPNRMVRTNIPMIDVFNSLVVSQKLPIFARAGEPYNELLARIRALLRRKTDVINTNELSYGDITLNLSNFELSCGEKKVNVSLKESEILRYFLTRPNFVVTKDELIIKLWGYDSDVEYNNIEVYISFLRKKLTFIGAKTGISTVRGVGYKLEA